MYHVLCNVYHIQHTRQSQSHKLNPLGLDSNQMVITGGYTNDRSYIYEQRVSNDKHVDLSQS